ncbi:MaoC family dehydratase [Arsenicicoccus dermatophilus]|uniref:MaoC family dehydratase n=1 Tax=Arsenicicoccus dermatophilus TaxID=1076331 RepID=UPI001F4C997E|nr:MaoC family dehydratase [Arsenicicoccus dermatophilus]MCH8614295.1 MaoC family dehydratase [Arsenicicoccus dermatophilus]
MKTFNGVQEIVAATGEHLGWSGWHQVTQEQVDQFAEATGDHQWIHVDPERAARETPFGGTIAHGYFTLSRIPGMLEEVYEVTGVTMGMNYGANKIRFLTPVRVGKAIRVGIELTDTVETKAGLQMILTMTVEVEGAQRPACIAEVVYLVVP